MSKSKDKFLKSQQEELSRLNVEGVFSYLSQLQKDEYDYWAKKDYENYLKKKKNESDRKKSI